MEETARPRRPEGLIAYKNGRDTLVCWNAVENAAGYHLYYRENRSPDKDYSGFAYTRANGELLRKPQVLDAVRDVTYRVTAVDGRGEESPMSDMVFPVRHRGLEILSIRYFSGGEVLTRLPDREVTVVVTALNSTDAVQRAEVLVKWDGRRKTFPLAIPSDGLLHTYDFPVGEVMEGPVEAVIQNEQGRDISCRSRFRPKGINLFDTLFERGLLIGEPYTEVLYSQEGEELPKGALSEGKWFDHFHMEFGLDRKEQPGKPENPFRLSLGKLQIRIWLETEADRRADGQLREEAEWKRAENCPGRSMEETCRVEVYETDRCLGSACASRKQEECVFHVYAGEDTLRIFLGEEHMPALVIPTGEAGGQLQLEPGDHTVRRLRIISQKPSFAGRIPFGKEEADPVWNIACWHSRYNWIREGICDEVKRTGDGRILIENPGRSFCLAPKGREVIIKARGSMEYEHTRRREEGWSHLLLEVLWDRQPCGRLRIADLQELWMTMDVRLLMCENRTRDYDSGIHAGQFVVFFNVSGIRNEAMWLGLCNFDSRFLEDENREKLTCQMDAGTNTFIIAPPQTELIQGHMADGQWHSMSLDLKPVIRMAYEKGREIQAFERSSFEDLRLNSMNLGFEIPGSFDMEFGLSNLQLTAVLEE